MAVRRRPNGDGVHSGALAKVRCEITPGLFSSERGVTIHLPGAHVVQTLVDITHVDPKTNPPSTGMAGTIVVTVVEKRGDSFIVDLPEPSFRFGTRVEVPANMVGPFR